MDIELRDYQEKLIKDIGYQFGIGKKKVLAVLPTGGGKTFCFSFITKGAVGKKLRVLILVHRRELLYQSSRSLSALSVDHGKIAPKFYGEIQMVAVASIQTLDQRLKKNKLYYDLIISDEAHHCGAETWKRVLSHFPNAKILGVTATPCRSDGQGLGVESGGIFEALVMGPQIGELIEKGHLVEPILYAPPVNLDLSGIRKKKGDYDQKELAARMDKPSIYGDAVVHYAKICPGVPTVVFCPSIEFAEKTAAAFREAGFSFEVIHGGLDNERRDDLINGLGSGRYQGLVSVDIISEGTDLPVLSCAIMLRPTHSLALFLQQGGRPLRTAPGKTRAFILDHVGNWTRHGLIEEDRTWTLDGVKRKLGSKEETIIIKQCMKCHEQYLGRSPTCPCCGHTKITESRQIKELDGELKRITKEEAAKQKEKNRKTRGWEEAQCMSEEDFVLLGHRRGYDNPEAWAKNRWTNSRRNK
jgi:superfamily II DNA or RNA helicase